MSEEASAKLYKKWTKAVHLSKGRVDEDDEGETDAAPTPMKRN